MGGIFIAFCFAVAIDLAVRIRVYSKTRDPKVKHDYIWWNNAE